MAPKRKAASVAAKEPAEPVEGHTRQRKSNKATATQAPVTSEGQPAKQRKTSKPPAAKPPDTSESKPARQRKPRKAAGTEGEPSGAAEKAAKTTTPEKPTELAKHTEYYLIKDEPSDYSIDELEKEKNQTAEWDGVRNYTARNVMKQMRTGQQVLFYRSGTKQPGVVGLVEVARDPYPDHTQFDENSKAFDPKATPEEPRWFMVDIKLKRKFENFVSLDTLKKHKETELEGLHLFRMSRLSVMSLTKKQFDFILQLADEPAS